MEITLGSNLLIGQCYINACMPVHLHDMYMTCTCFIMYICIYSRHMGSYSAVGKCQYVCVYVVCFLPRNLGDGFLSSPSVESSLSVMWQRCNCLFPVLQTPWQRCLFTATEIRIGLTVYTHSHDILCMHIYT